MREFDSGATRDDNQTKPDYAGFIDPIVLYAFGEYMHKHRIQADGSLRASDNWRKGIPRQAYIESMFRHFLDVWFMHDMDKRGEVYEERQEEALCALLFNVMGYLSQLLRGDVGE